MSLFSRVLVLAVLFIPFKSYSYGLNINNCRGITFENDSKPETHHWLNAREAFEQLRAEGGQESVFYPVGCQLDENGEVTADYIIQWNAEHETYLMCTYNRNTDKIKCDTFLNN